MSALEKAQDQFHVDTAAEEEKMEEGVARKSSASLCEEEVHKTAVNTAVRFGLHTVIPKKKTPKEDLSAGPRRLSTVSRMYDMDGDGQLDEAEQAMRNMDKSNRGHLTNDRVYKLMKDHFDDQKQLFKMKKVLIGLSILVLLLTLSNLGTSFAAAYLAKDTTVNDKTELVSSDTKTALSTQATTTKFGVESLPDEELYERRLQSPCTESETEVDCETESGGFNGFAIVERGTRENGACGTIQTQCERGNHVDITRTFSNRERVTINICGPSTRVTENVVKGLVQLKSPGLTKINMQYTDYGCKFDGPDLTQQTGEVCDTGSDCARQHKCYQPSEYYVRRCQSDCASRFRKNSSGSQRAACNDSCVNTNTCERINDVLMLAGETLHPTFSPTTTPRPTASPTTTGPTTKSPTSRPSTSSAPSKSPQPSMSPSISSVPTVSKIPCPEQYTLTKTYNTGNEVICGGEDNTPPVCQSSSNSGRIWYYNGKKWKDTSKICTNGLVDN